ncbi:kirola-like [Diospyros lotus]|uniref:kirola-like n=1 Tax=Diospyros lotus TaxID=55363 RepID=UPI002253E8B5|nr:kirola-like [Diospyros lotus]
MGLTGKMERQIELKSGGDLLHEIFKSKPHHVSGITPAKVQGCSLIQGEWGKNGSIICWNYTHDGKEKTAKQVIEVFDGEKKTIVFRIIEGDLLQLYKTFIILLHEETKGGKNWATWAFDYEKLGPDVEDPVSLLDYLTDVVKDIDAHHSK